MIHIHVNIYMIYIHIAFHNIW